MPLWPRACWALQEKNTVCWLDQWKICGFSFQHTPKNNFVREASRRLLFSFIHNFTTSSKHPGPPFPPLSIRKWPLLFLDGCKDRDHWWIDFISSQALFSTISKLICIPITLSYSSSNYKEKAIPFIWDFLLLSVPLMSSCLPLGSCPSILLSSTSHLSLPNSLGFIKMVTSPFKEITALLQPMPFSSSLCILLFLDKLLEEMIHLLPNLAFFSTIPLAMTSLFLPFSLTSLSNYSQLILFPLTSLSSYSQCSFHLVNKHRRFRYSTYYSHTIFHLNQDTLQRERYSTGSLLTRALNLSLAPLQSEPPSLHSWLPFTQVGCWILDPHLQAWAFRRATARAAFFYTGKILLQIQLIPFADFSHCPSLWPQQALSWSVALLLLLQSSQPEASESSSHQNNISSKLSPNSANSFS